MTPQAEPVGHVPPEPIPSPTRLRPVPNASSGPDLRRFTERIRAHASRQVSFSDQGKLVHTSFTELATDVENLSRALATAGLTRETRVGVVASNGRAWLTLDLAILQIGCEIVALPADATERSAEDLAREYSLGCLFCCDLTPGGEGYGQAPWVCMPGQQSPRSLRPAPTPSGSRRADFRVLSSGSTGQPKCILVDREGLEGIIAALAHDFDVTENDRLLLFLPAANLQQRFLVYAALWQGVSFTLVEPLWLLSAMMAAPPTILLVPPVFLEALLRRVRARRISRLWLGCVTLLSRSRVLRPLGALIGYPMRRRLAQQLGGRLRILITGMAPIAPTLLRQLEALALPVYEAYGMTETGIIACNTPAQRRLGSVGKPAHGVAVRIDSEGEVFVRREPALTWGYSDGSAGTYLDDGWVRTGDMGYFDSDGFLYLNGRKKNVIILSNGFKVHPEDIERQLMGCAGLSAAVVVMLTHSVACAVQLEPTNSAEREALLARIEARLAELLHGQPARIVIMPDGFSVENGLRTPNMKFAREAIRERVASLHPRSSDG